MTQATIDQRVVDAIAEDYFAPFEVDAADDDPNFKRSSEAWWRIQKIVRRDPDKGWALLLALLDRAPNEDGLGLLAAGPIEDFVREHGSAFLDRIDLAAAESERLRRALSWTYGWNVMPADVADRLMRHFSDEDREYWLGRRRGQQKRRAPRKPSSQRAKVE
jgi:hypothetical protein